VKLLPAALIRPNGQVSKAQAPKKAEPEISAASAAALALLAIAGVFIVGEAFLSRIALTADERGALLNTLLLCDIVVLCFALLTTVIPGYFYSARYGRHRGLMSQGRSALFGAMMALPIVYIASDLAFKPEFFSAFEAELALGLSAMGIAALALCCADVLEHARPDRILSRYLEEITGRYMEQQGPAGPAALQRPVLRGGEGLGLMAMIDRLCRQGDSEPVINTLEEMKTIALEPAKSTRSIALAASMVSLMCDTAAAGAKHGRHEVVYRALGRPLGRRRFLSPRRHGFPGVQVAGGRLQRVLRGPGRADAEPARD